MTVMDAALRESLKALRLSGMLETLDARLAQAHGGELGRLDFLQVLCRDEITRRETIAFQRRLQRAKFEQQVTLEEFGLTASSKLPAAQIRDLGALRWLHAGESVILFGPVGVGKTHIAQALGHLAVRQGAHVRFAKTSRILADLAGGHADRTREKRIRELIRPDVLILDDFAMRQLSAAQADDLYELVSERQGRSLIITSNRAPSEWHPLFPNPVVAESLLDRLINTSHQVIMNGPSYRPNKRPRNSTDKTKWGKPVDVVGILPSWPSPSSLPASRRSISPPAASQPTNRRMEILSGIHLPRMFLTWTGPRSCSNGSVSWRVSMASIALLCGRLSAVTPPSTSPSSARICMRLDPSGPTPRPSPRLKWLAPRNYSGRSTFRLSWPPCRQTRQKPPP